MDVPHHLPCESGLRVVEIPGRNNNGHLRRQALGSRMFSERAWTEIARSFRLSTDELQILRAVFDDRSELTIAVDAGIPVNAVNTELEHLHHKLAVTSRVEMIQRVTDQFLALTASPQSVLPSICANRTAGRCPLRRD
jgi:DNA-binding CsgD family transcriptional regulator